MGRTNKKQPQHQSTAQVGPKKRNGRARYNNIRPARDGVLPLRPVPPPTPQRISAPRRPRKYNRKPRYRTMVDHYSPPIKIERSSSRLDLSQIPLVPALELPIREKPPSSPSVQIKIETPSPIVKIETPNCPLAGSIHIDSPTGFFRGQAADSPTILWQTSGNRKPLSGAVEILKRTMAPQVQNSPHMPARLLQLGPQIPRSVPSPLATESRLVDTGKGLFLPLQGANPMTRNQRFVSQSQRRESGELGSPLALKTLGTISNAEQSYQAVKRLNLIEPVGPTRILFPAKLVRYVFETTFDFLNRKVAGTDAYQVTAYITANGDSSELYCGTFSLLEQANARVLQVFGRDPFQLMTERYTDMVFKEAAEPGQGDIDAIDKSQQRRQWTAFGFDDTYTTLRAWARDDFENWSFRVEAVRI
ncbi:hypothetical protein F4775DRAFT_579937 [Biscogniauxia sp. FL1348]|nr:hypothetical protein F4775DRAFT_579937 [Biscogniauxia sp. FL1348]